MSIKSGTNRLHGSVYYFAEPKSLAANDFFGNMRGQERPDTSSNRPGFSLTGPVRIPGLYDGEDKTFFSVGYERIKDVRPRFDAPADSWVPSEALRRGDFSEFSQFITIYDPLTRVPTGNGQYVGQPFPGNVIPADRISPVARQVLDYYSLPKGAGLSGNIYDSTLPETADYDTFTVPRRPEGLEREQDVRARQLVPARQPLQRLHGQRAHQHQLPVHLLAGRRRRRPRLQRDHGPERPLRLQPLRAQLGPGAGLPELRPGDLELPSVLQHPDSRGEPLLPASRLRRQHHGRRRVRQRLPADHLPHSCRHAEQGAVQALAPGRHGDADLPRGQPIDRQRAERPLPVHERLHAAEQRERHGLPGAAELRRVPARDAFDHDAAARLGLLRVLEDLGLVRAGRLAHQRQADPEPRPALGARDGAHRAQRQERVRVRLRLRTADRACRPRRATPRSTIPP